MKVGTTPARSGLLSLLLLVACNAGPQTGGVSSPATAGSAAPQGATSTPATTAPSEAPPRAEFDPVAQGLTVEGVKQLCDEHLRAAEGHLDAIRALRGAPPEKLTYAATLGRFDDAALEVNSAGEFPYLMGVAHPDAAVREAARLCEPKVDRFTTAMWLDADLAAVIEAYAEKGGAREALNGERARLLSDVLRDFRRNGLSLPVDRQQRLRDVNEQITRIGQEFMSNLSASTASIEIAPAALQGLPKEYVAKHAPKANGKVEITTDYPDFFPFVTYAKDRKAALDLYVLFTNRGGEKNVKLVDRLLALRSEKAKMLGYKSWADYAIEPRMAKTSGAVRGFLDQVRTALKEPAKAEFSALMKEHVRLGGKPTDKLPPSDRYFLEDRVRASTYQFDSQALSDYLELGAVKQGLMDITAKMYALEYKEVPAKAWHPDVTAYEVRSEGKLIGKFYLDLYSRPDKYKHAAMFTVRTAKLLDDGSWQSPVAALECNFPKPGAQPALMSHEDVVTFFHEFGHVLHHLLTRSELASYSGTATVRDFVEAPSQMFEEWAWSREVLDLFAKHHATGEKIPDALFQAMTRARGFGRALATQRQLTLASIDLELHTRDPGFDATVVVEQAQRANESFAFVKGTHLQSSFGHLITYDAGYYGYQWALSLSRDVLTRFKQEGLLNPAVARAFRDEVLAKGGGVEAGALVTRFLGRPPSHDAYLAYLRGKE
ncbi:M3 family metallopeptidase [Sorangium sp. So ce1504]|uniref:M3 family metallopeptidase n=1 Tax=Sorangium sp. So ce1504 TaxID=3133337 RepID=UPI003F60D569